MIDQLDLETGLHEVGVGEHVLSGEWAAFALQFLLGKRERASCRGRRRRARDHVHQGVLEGLAIPWSLQHDDPTKLVEVAGSCAFEALLREDHRLVFHLENSAPLDEGVLRAGQRHEDSTPGRTAALARSLMGRVASNMVSVPS